MVNLESPLYGLKFEGLKGQKDTVIIRNLHDEHSRDNLLDVIQGMQGTGIGKLIFDLSKCSSDKKEELMLDVGGMCKEYGFGHAYTGLEKTNLQQ